MDLDGDGYGDILSGCYSRFDSSMAGLFYLLRGQPDGTFEKPEELKGTDGEPLIIPGKDNIQKICTRPFAVDWDGDGHLDLVVGNFAGTFYLFKGEGEGKFLPEPEQIMAGDQPLKIQGAHSDPFVIDWDGDGDLDLLSGSSSGGVQWAENIAGSGEPPRFERFKTLIEPGRRVEYGQLLREDELTGPVSDTRIWVADVNADGKLDLLVGDNVTLISPAEGLSEDEFKEKFAAWRKSIEQASRELSSARSDDDSDEQRTQAIEQYRKAYQQRDEFMKEDRTGFVWLYVQK